MQPTSQGRDYYEHMWLAEHACFILCMHLGTLAEDKDIDYNDP